MLTQSPIHLLRKLLQEATKFLHHIVLARFKSNDSSKKNPSFVFKVSDRHHNIMEKTGEIRGIYGISGFRMIDGRSQEFVHSAEAFENSRLHEVKDLGRLLDHVLKRNKFYGASQADARVLAIIRNSFSHRPCLRHASRDPNLVHEEVLQATSRFLSILLNLVDMEELEKKQNVETSTVKFYRNILASFKHSISRMRKMQASSLRGESIDVGASLQAWQRKIDSELREGSNSSASVALMGLVGSRFEQTEKLGDGKRAGSGDRAAEESEEDWTVAKKDDNFKKGVDVGIPVYDHKEAVVSVLYDPMAVTNQDLVNTGFDALSLILWDIEYEFGKKDNFQGQCFAKLRCIVIDEDGLCDLSGVLLREAQDPAAEFEKFRDPSMLLEVAATFFEPRSCDRSTLTKAQLSELKKEEHRLQGLRRTCQDLILLCRALSHHAVQADGEQLKAKNAADALAHMSAVAHELREIALASGHVMPGNIEHHMELLEVLETELQKGSNYKKFRRRERQAEYLASQGKALVYMSERLLPLYQNLPEEELAILRAQLERVPDSMKFFAENDSMSSDTASLELGDEMGLLEDADAFLAGKTSCRAIDTMKRALQEFLDKRKPEKSPGLTITADEAEQMLAAVDKADMQTLGERLKQLHLAQLSESAEISARALKKLVKDFRQHYAGTTSQGQLLGHQLELSGSQKKDLAGCEGARVSEPPEDESLNSRTIDHASAAFEQEASVKLAEELQAFARVLGMEPREVWNDFEGLGFAHLTDFQKAVLNKFGWRPDKALGDGNCLFHSVARAVGQDHKTVRRRGIQWLTRNFTKAAAIPERFPDLSEEYLETMARDTEQGDGTILQALAEEYGRRMVVLSNIPAQCWQVLDPEELQHSTPVVVLYTNTPYQNRSCGHYDAVVLLQAELTGPGEASASDAQSVPKANKNKMCADAPSGPALQPAAPSQTWADQLTTPELTAEWVVSATDSKRTGDIFLEEEITGKSLRFFMTEEKLQKLGVKSGPSEVLLWEWEKLKNQ